MLLASPIDAQLQRVIVSRRNRRLQQRCRVPLALPHASELSNAEAPSTSGRPFEPEHSTQTTHSLTRRRVHLAGAAAVVSTLLQPIVAQSADASKLPGEHLIDTDHVVHARSTCATLA
jgi:hypothetical protein